MTTYDGLIIGAGHNGLTLAAYLARAGLTVAVLERNPWIGGGTCTDEPILPGFRCNLHSNFYNGIAEAPLVHDLELYRFGFSFVEPPVQKATTFRDGTALVIHKDPERTQASFARFSKRDAEAFRYLHELYGRTMRPLFVSLLYHPPLAPSELAARLSGPQGKEYLAHAELDLFQAVDRYFEDDRVRAFFKSYLHIFTAENEPGTGHLLPSMFSTITRVGLPCGGSGAFAAALGRVVEAAGGHLRTGADVREILVESGRATGVRLADGTRLQARRFVASAIDAPATMRLAGEAQFPPEVREKLRRWNWGSHTIVTIHLALNEPPLYRSAHDPDVNRAYDLFFGFDGTDEVQQCFEECKRGEFPRYVMGNGACNSRFDPTYAPAGKHVAFWWTYAPYALDGDPRAWDRRKAELTERMLAEWRGYAPNLTPANVLGAYLFSPLDVERRNVNMVQGSNRMGAYVASQLGINRPHPLLSQYRTPVDGLYLCGSSSHGGGANGAPGYNAANVIADDLKLGRFWTPVPTPSWTN
jgi:phytoene dehydrogenase-like protein